MPEADPPIGADPVADISVRAGTSADVDGVLAFWRTATSVPSTTDDPEALGALLERDPSALVLAEADGHLVGTAIVAWDGWRGAIYRLAVAPGARRRGVARSLVVAAERRLRGLGARRAAVTVVTDHEHATGFWEAMGYVHDARMARFVKQLR